MVQVAQPRYDGTWRYSSSTLCQIADFNQWINFLYGTLY